MSTTRAEMQVVLARRLGSLHESRWMLDEILGRHYPQEAPVDDASRAALEKMAARREGGEPLQYVLGTWAFRSLELEVDARALIPRPETEQLVEVALGEIRDVPAPVLVDLGTGTGAIALSLAVELGATSRAVELGATSRALEVWATDIDRGALELARRNRSRAAASASGAQLVRLVRGRWFDALPTDRRGRVDLVVSNPPYVSDDEWRTLDRQVQREPYNALVSGSGSDGTPGFADIETIVRAAGDWLTGRGVLLVELSPPQACAALRLARDCGYRTARIHQDLAGRDRMLVARR